MHKENALYYQMREYNQYRILYLIIILIGFQQFPVINVGGSLKIYEVLALLILLLYRPKIKWDTITIGLFILFVFSPLLSFFNSLLFLNRPDIFFVHYKEARDSLKFDNPLYTFLQLIYMFFNFAVIIAIIKNDYIYINIDKIVKKVVWVGTFISIYSLICFIIDYNPILQLPNSIQKISLYHYRTLGFSQEPSFYVLFQGWIVLFSFYLKDKMKFKKWLLLFFINFLSLLLTFSSSLVAYLIIVLVSLFLFKIKKKYLFLLLIIIGGGCVLLYYIFDYFGMMDVAIWTFVDKLDAFVINENMEAVSSGGQRGYTIKIGYEIFKEYPILGVGVGNSVFYMISFGDIVGRQYYEIADLGLGMMPLSLYSCVLSEQGILGFLGLIIIMIYVSTKTFNCRNKSELSSFFFIGVIFNFAVMFAIPIVYSLFLWVFMALGIGYNQRLIKDEKNTSN